MNLQFYLEKLNSSNNFKNFMKENPSAFLCSGFFVIDKQGNDNKQHFDFYIPLKHSQPIHSKDKEFNEKTEAEDIGKIMSFQLENKMQLVPLQSIDKKIPEKISIGYDLNFNEIEKMIVEEMKKQKIKNKIQKIMFSLQKLKGKDFLIGTIFISMLALLKINIDVKEKKIISFEKKSFMDMLKIVKRKKGV